MHITRYPSRGVLITPLLFILGSVVAGQAQTPPVIPIPQQLFLAKPVPVFIGTPAVPNPITDVLPVPQSPFMAPNGRNSLHLDGYQSDTYPYSGPLGNQPVVTSSFLAAECGTVTFDSKGRVNTVCIGLLGPELYLLDPDTLGILARFSLPSSGTTTTFGSGGYYFLDQLDRSVIPTRTRDIWIIKTVEDASGKPSFMRDHTCALDLPLRIPQDESIQSVLPDASGLLWFTTGGGANKTEEPAIVGTVRPNPTHKNRCDVSLYPLPAGEGIQKSFAVDPDPARGGVFIVSDHQMYRFDADPRGNPTLTWNEPYDRGTSIKPGQIVQGSGTTPTLMGTDYVTIDDNADSQIDVVVYRRAPQVNRSRLVCKQPVFEPGSSASFNSLIATDHSISIENNYGNLNLASTLFGNTTAPGITRIDLDDDGNGCHVVWSNTVERVPNVVSQLSLATGLEYTYTKDPSPSDAPYTDAWYFTAIDFATGNTVFKVLAGTGIFFNSNYSGLYLGPDGKTGYVGVLGGIVRIHDTQ